MEQSHFNDNIVKQLVQFFQPYGFLLLKQENSLLRFESPLFNIILIHDFRNHEHSLWLSSEELFEFEAHDDLLTRFFQQPVHIAASSPGQFAKNVIAFFQHEGLPLLDDNQRLHLLEQQAREDLLNYNMKMQLLFAVNKADAAWEENNFVGFVEAMKEIELKHLPKSYSLKLAIAKKKLVNKIK